MIFRIRRVFDDTVKANSDAIRQVQAILRSRFPGIRRGEVDQLPAKLHNPLKARFRPILYVSENGVGVVDGFALLLHAPDLRFCYLDYLSVALGKSGRGLGGILYENVRKQARLLDVVGIFLECLPDDPILAPEPDVRKQNVARLKFYEHYGVRPIVNTKYETPVTPEDENPPYLLFDDLGRGRYPSAQEGGKIVRAILTRKYGGVCSPEYIKMVAESFQDSPIRLRPLQYIKKPEYAAVPTGVPEADKFLLVVNEKHKIHHVHDKGYVESPVRIKSILRSIEKLGLFRQSPAKRFSDRYIYAIHDRKYVDYFKTICSKLPESQPIYPYVFPVRNAARPPKDLTVRAGYFCIDTFTPLTANAYSAARGAVDCALTGAQGLLEGVPLAYALVRPPGHHAERGFFGGFCYFNSAAIAAQYLVSAGRVAILDIDHHHGNGQQDIFYARNDVLTISLHGHPNVAYPYFSGFATERGEGAGTGYNHNFPLPENIDGEKYRVQLQRAFKEIRRFAPEFLIVALGLDTAKNDPTGSWLLDESDFYENGLLIGGLGLSTLVVQEGGYENRVVGRNAAAFFKGLWDEYVGRRS